MKPLQPFCKFLFYLLLFFISPKIISAQSLLFPEDITGKPINLKTEVNVTGTPYFPDSYTTSALYLKGGRKIENVKSKIYLPDYSVLYSVGDTIEMVAVTEIERIEFFFFGNDMSQNKPSKMEFILLPSSVDPNALKKYYQVLDTGKINLLKLYATELTEGKEFGSASITRTYTKRTDMYSYSYVNGFRKITNAQSLLSSVFSDKKSEMVEFISQNNINVRREKDLEKLFLYYNNL